MNREEAVTLLEKHLGNPRLRNHCYSVEACMRALAGRLGHDPEPWALAGLVHDLDYEKTDKSPELHTVETAVILGDLGIDPVVIHAVQAHAGRVPCETPMDWAIFSADPLTGLIIAAALMHPEKRLKAIDLAFLKKRYKEKGFARGARREDIGRCVELGLGLDEFLSICLEAMQGIDKTLGL